VSQARSQWDCHPRGGFTLVEVLVTITLISTGILVLGGMLLRSARAAEAASAVSYQTAAMASEVARMDALPFTALAAGTTCDTLAVAQLPRIRCSIVAVVSPKLTRVTVRITAIGNPLVPADSVIFERSISGDVVPPLNTP
jgi:prepilin-type N-terminal cleavage/methylation domain-containing protein